MSVPAPGVFRAQNGQILLIGKTIGRIVHKPAVVVDSQSADSWDSVSSPKTGNSIDHRRLKLRLGAHLKGEDTLSGLFSKQLVRKHINYKELLARLFTLQN